MIRIKSNTGVYFDNPDDLQLEVERTNPFFNDYGEQSLPVTLPATEKNRKLVEHTERLAAASKTSQKTDTSIESGAYCVNARMAILSSNRKTGYECSFYMNTGAFNEKIQNVTMHDIFKDETIQIGTVTEAIAYCRQLYTGTSDIFSIFPILTSDGALNALTTANADDGYPDFVNASDTTETIDETSIAVPAGFYITPFIRAFYLLKRVLTYFGYTLTDNFLSTTEPFSSMVFLNNTIDTIVKGKIRLMDCIPEVEVTTLLKFFRKKFNCEFIPDETHKTVDIRMMNEVTDAAASVDLTPYLDGPYTVEHPDSYLQLKLTCNHQDAPEMETEYVNGSTNRILRSYEDKSNDFGSLLEILNKYPKCDVSPVSGEITRQGFNGVHEVIQRLGYLDQDYWAGGTLEAETVESPDSMPHMVYIVHQINLRVTTVSSYTIRPYLSSSRALNSQIVIDSQNVSEDDGVSTSSTMNDDTSDDQSLEIIPCFAIRRADGKANIGNIYNYNDAGTRVYDYSLAYHGVDGLYEKFWRKYDDILRNSKSGVKCNIILPEHLKMSLSECNPVMIDGQKVLPDSVKFVPDQDVSEECSFKTIRQYTPVSSAITETDRLSACHSPYKWQITWAKSIVASGGGRQGTTKSKWKYVSNPINIYYDPPTEAEFTAQTQCHQMEYPVQFYSNVDDNGNPTDAVSGYLTTYLTATTNS